MKIPFYEKDRKKARATKLVQGFRQHSTVFPFWERDESPVPR